MISIIIPAYNSRATIVEALESVLAQSLWASSVERGAPSAEDSVERGEPSALLHAKPSSSLGPRPSLLQAKYEVIVVDDCSTDDTVAVVKRWIAQRPEDSRQRTSELNPRRSALGAPCSRLTSHVSRFTLHALPANGGPAKARNKGIQEAQGDWIAFLDADDVWLPHRLEAGMHYVRVHPYTAMVCGKSILIGGENFPRMIPARELEAHYFPGDFLTVRNYSLSDFLMVNPVATSTVLIRKDVLIQAGGFDEQFRGPEDYDLWLRVVAISPVVRLEIPVTGYRHRPGSLSLDDRKFLPQILRVLDKAYVRGGVYGNRKGNTRAVAYQWLCGAWSAAERGDIRRAVQCFVTSLMHWPWPFRGDKNLKWAKSKVGYYILRSMVRKRGNASLDM